jgi:hypothetical protein
MHRAEAPWNIARDFNRNQEARKQERPLQQRPLGTLELWLYGKARQLWVWILTLLWPGDLS